MSDFINRTIKKAIKQIEDTFPIIMITGPRQVRENYIVKDVKRRI